MKKTALVIGGNRFFGRHLVQSFLDEGFDVTLLNRGNNDDGFLTKVKRLIADRRDFEALDKVLRNTMWDFVVDQVCFTGPEAKALGQILTGKTKRLGVTSSQSVYELGYEIPELTFNPESYNYKNSVSASENYSEAKRQMESEIIQFKDLNPVLFRFPFVLGRDDYTQRLNWHVERVQKKLPIYFPKPESRLGFIHSKEAGSLIKKIMQTDALGGINCASPGEVTLSKLMETISKATHSEWIAAKNQDSENHSPYGVKADWTMSTDLLKSLGIELSHLEIWLPNLIREISLPESEKG